jgi:hypothetical protein
VPRELASDIGERPQSLCALEEDDLVNGGMSAHEARRTRLQHPRDVRRRSKPLDGIHDGQHVHRVADGAHHHDTDTIER